MATYITESQADARYTKHLPRTVLQWDDVTNDYVVFDVWGDATTTEKTQALEMATAFINDLDYDGEKAVGGQDNAFPRNSQTSIPEEVKRACFVLALYFLEENKKREFMENTIRKAKEAGLQSYSTDIQSASESFRWGADEKTAYSIVIPYLKKWVKGRYSITRWRF